MSDEAKGMMVIACAIAMVLLFVVAIVVAAIQKPKEFGEAMVKGIDAAKANWAAQQEAKKKKREETGNAIASILANIMKKRS